MATSERPSALPEGDAPEDAPALPGGVCHAAVAVTPDAIDVERYDFQPLGEDRVRAYLVEVHRVRDEFGERVRLVYATADGHAAVLRPHSRWARRPFGIAHAAVVPADWPTVVTGDAAARFRDVVAECHEVSQP